MPLFGVEDLKIENIFSDELIGALSSEQKEILNDISGNRPSLPTDNLIENYKKIKVAYVEKNTDKNTKIVKKFISNIQVATILKGNIPSVKDGIIENINNNLPKPNSNQIGGKRKRRYKIRKTRKKSKVSKKKTLRFKYKI